MTNFLHNNSSKNKEIASLIVPSMLIYYAVDLKWSGVVHYTKRGKLNAIAYTTRTVSMLDLTGVCLIFSSFVG